MKAPSLRPWCSALAMFVALLIPGAANAQEADAPPSATSLETLTAPEPDLATVSLDGIALFRVAGLNSLPSDERARRIVERIVRAAGDPAVAADSIRAVEIELGSEVVASGALLMVVTDSDARLEKATRSQVAWAVVRRIRGAVTEYRLERTPGRIAIGALKAAGVVALAILFALVLGWIARIAQRAIEAGIGKRTEGIKIQSVEVIRAERIHGFLGGLIRGIRTILVLAILFVALGYVLQQFPWTRGFAVGMLGHVLDPLGALGRALLGFLPNLLFLIVLVLLVRYLLKLLGFLAGAIEHGAITVSGFDREWAWPTYRIVRTLVIVFSLVIAFPFIPGSKSPAFKGISIFMGVLISLGSPSVAGNILAGYTMIYRRAFRLGDRVLIDDVLGEVVATRLLVTHLRTPKNEEIVIPNSLILNSKVTNYTTLARTTGLILHTMVGIGYEVPWRQVEAMLLMAADRTPGAKKEPRPFVLERGLGDFAVQYEINVYTDRPDRILETYAALHRNILDAFNEHGVQIMTPAYEGDPDTPKVVPRAQWHAAPAAPPAASPPV